MTLDEYLSKLDNLIADTRREAEAVEDQVSWEDGRYWRGREDALFDAITLALMVQDA